MRSLHLDRNLPVVTLALLALAAALLLIRPSQSPATLVGRTLGQPQTIDAPQLSSRTASQIQTLQSRIRRNPGHVDSYALLGHAYLQQARETGDPSYYTKAESVFDTALKRDPQHVEALIGKGSLALARHDFRAALKLGEQARSINPSVPRIYGVIGDAQIELGQYDAAVATIQQMVDLRPDLSSYSRVSYLRELYGDRQGAIDAMQQAVTAGGPTAENTQWVRVQLGHLYFNEGDLKAAEQQYREALARLPEYAHAQAGLARVRAAQGRHAEAIELYSAATQRMPLPEYLIALGDVYAIEGDQQRAQQQYDLVLTIDKLLGDNGVNTDLELALFCADHAIELPQALAKARAAYAARPSIHAADSLAWTLYTSGSYVEAQRYAAEALRLGTDDPLKLFHAGIIAQALGHNDQARDYLQRAVDLNPHFSLLYSDRASTTLATLGGNVPAAGRP
ncbi:MAG: tetratricopeptide repeat protein [Chloroflexi bacterium]|nr:tetratricopeptide repeat protein [Chloroflexota bacterium]